MTMKPDVIIIDSDISYGNRIKESLASGGHAHVVVRVSLDSLCADCDGCRGHVIIARGEGVRYSDLLACSHGEDNGSVCPRARFILTYDCGRIDGDLGLAGCAHCVSGREDAVRLLELVNEEISDYFTDSDDEYNTADALRDLLDGLGFDPSHKGYGYLLIAAEMTDSEMITKDIYPDIAKRNKTTASAVERSIRSAVSAAWSHGGLKRFARYIDWKSEKRPTNRELLSALASRRHTKLV